MELVSLSLAGFADEINLAADDPQMTLEILPYTLCESGVKQ